MLGFKNFDCAAITIASLVLLHRTGKGQFVMGRQRLKGKAASAIWIPCSVREFSGIQTPSPRHTGYLHQSRLAYRATCVRGNRSRNFHSSLAAIEIVCQLIPCPNLTRRVSAHRAARPCPRLDGSLGVWRAIRPHSPARPLPFPSASISPVHPDRGKELRW